MRILLSVESGPELGRLTEIPSGASVTIGRADDVAFPLPRDISLSRRHFCVEAADEGGRIADLGSTNGTFRNGERVGEAPVADGDCIRAGETTFLARLLHTPAATSGREAGAAAKAAAVPVPPRDEPLRLLYRPCSSGLVELRPAEPLADPTATLRALRASAPLHALLDASKLGPDAEVPDGAPLLDGVPSEASPLVLVAPEAEALASVLELAWSSDALVLLVSSREPDELVAHLRRAARDPFGSKEPDPAPAAVGFYVPSLARVLLAHGPEADVKRLVEGVDALLMESRSGGSFVAFAPPERLRTLEGPFVVEGPEEP